MRKILLAAASLAALSLPTMAADMSAPAGYDWSGPYIGAVVGYGWGDSDNQSSIGPAWSADLEGFQGGVIAGYNFQTDALVLGLEVNANMSAIDGSAPCPNPAFTCGTDVNWYAAARGRVGVAMDTFLLYGTGGVAWADADFSNTSGAGVTVTESDTSIGLVVGGGVEWAMSENVALRVEALYYDFNDFDFGWSNDGATTYDSGVDFVTAQVGVTVQF